MRVDQPARAEFMSATVVVMADAAGAVGRVSTHDIRRGTARDLSRLPSRSGMDIYDIGAVLGHSVQTTQKGVTSRYVGPRTRNHFNERAYAEPVLDPLALRYAALEQEPESSATAVQAVQAAKVIKGISTQKRRVEQTHHNVECEARGVTVSDDVWRKPSPLPPAPSIWWITDKGQLGVAHTRLTLDTLPPNSIDDRRLIKTSEDSQEGDEPVSDEEEQTDDDEETVVSNNKNAGTMANWLEGLAEETIEDDYSEEQNTLLAALDDDTFEVSTEALMQCITANNSLEVEQFQAIVINNEAMQHSPYHTHVEYVDAFARCNVLAYHAMAVTVDTLGTAEGLSIEPPEDLPYGNARNHPTPHAFRCRVSETCNFANVARQNRKVHEGTCKAEQYAAQSESEGDGADSKETFSCPKAGCTRVYKDRDTLAKHQKEHKRRDNWVPKPCPDGCDNNKLFKTSCQFKDHRRAYHPQGFPAPCPIDGCEGTSFTAWNLLKKNFRKTYSIKDKDEMEKLRPSIKTEVFDKKPCIIQGCTTLGILHSPNALTLHLHGRHGWTDDAEIAEFIEANYKTVKEFGKANRDKHSAAILKQEGRQLVSRDLTSN